MTNTDKIIEFLRQNPKATNESIARHIDASSDVTRTLIARLKRRGVIEDIGTPGEREFRVLKSPAAEKYEYKKDMYESMCDAYFDDFMKAELYSDRIEIGKLICRILEKI